LVRAPLPRSSSTAVSLYVSIIGNDDALEVLPITEMVFDSQGGTRPHRGSLPHGVSSSVAARLWQTGSPAHCR
jgi:hypothetical protein